METPDARGILYPTRLPTFHRLPPPAEVAEWVRWFWIPRWQLAPGRTSRQEILAFPACNLTIEPNGVFLSGPTTRISHRDLTGNGWAVGILLRPAALPGLGVAPAIIRDTQRRINAAELHDTIVTAMTGPEHDVARDLAVAACTDWLTANLPPPDEAALLANRLEDIVGSERAITRVEHLAERLHLSVRSVQRLTERHFGLPPLTIIRRYRLQEAAQRLREDPAVTVAAVAADLGYADHAHLTSDFRLILGFTPSTYRRGLG